MGAQVGYLQAYLPPHLRSYAVPTTHNTHTYEVTYEVLQQNSNTRMSEHFREGSDDQAILASLHLIEKQIAKQASAEAATVVERDEIPLPSETKDS